MFVKLLKKLNFKNMIKIMTCLLKTNLHDIYKWLCLSAVDERHAMGPGVGGLAQGSVFVWVDAEHQVAGRANHSHSADMSQLL